MSTLLGIILGIVLFCLGYTYGEKASKDMIQDSAYIESTER